jgi:hypothetical protein
LREFGAPQDVVEAVCRAALDAVRGYGEENARGMAKAAGAGAGALDELGRERREEPTSRWLARRLPGS